MPMPGSLMCSHDCCASGRKPAGYSGRCNRGEPASHRAAPGLCDAFVARGNALQLVGDAAEVERAFERAIALDPRDFNAYYWFGKYRAGRGEHAEAAKQYERAFEIRPDDYRPITLAIQEYQALKDREGEQSAVHRSWRAIERHAGARAG